MPIMPEKMPSIYTDALAQHFNFCELFKDFERLSTFILFKRLTLL